MKYLVWRMSSTEGLEAKMHTQLGLGTEAQQGPRVLWNAAVAAEARNCCRKAAVLQPLPHPPSRAAPIFLPPATSFTYTEERR